MNPSNLNIQKIMVYGIMGLWVLFCAFPFFWTIMTSIKTPVDAFSNPPVWVFEPTAMNYANLWLEFGFSEFLINSVIVTLGVVVISLSIGCFAGYALARYPGKLGFWLLMLALVFRSLPHTVFLIPYYEFTRMVGLYDTHIVLILVLVAINQPFTIWMMRSFFMNIPKELEESAMMDGCNQFQAFAKAIVPVMWPGIIKTGLFTFLLAYNEFLIPLTLTATNAATMPVAISQFGADDIKYWSMTAAGAVSITLPIVALIIFFQKKIVSGLVAGAVKG